MKLPRFTLRELCLLVVIAAMGCGWWVDHRKGRVWRATANNFLYFVRMEGWTVYWKPNGQQIDRIEPPADVEAPTYGFEYDDSLQDQIFAESQKPPRSRKRDR